MRGLKRNQSNYCGIQHRYKLNLWLQALGVNFEYEYNCSIFLYADYMYIIKIIL